jgi:transcriptional regulator GlxA family with amidase domain
MKVALLLFPGVTALDAIGPYEVLARVPGWQVEFVAAEAGPVPTDTGITSITAGTSIDEFRDPDVLLVPGGQGTREAMEDAGLLKWVGEVSGTARWTTSVCTGALVLAAAGLLEGRRATTHWLYLERLREFGAEPVAERVVTDGKIVTAAGVSAGIDMALRFVGETESRGVAEAIQLGIEYDPQPPFGSGSPDGASPDTVELVTAIAALRDDWLATRREGP